MFRLLQIPVWDPKRCQKVFCQANILFTTQKEVILQNKTILSKNKHNFFAPKFNIYPQWSQLKYNFAGKWYQLHKMVHMCTWNETPHLQIIQSVVNLYVYKIQDTLHLM